MASVLLTRAGLTSGLVVALSLLLGGCFSSSSSGSGPQPPDQPPPDYDYDSTYLPGQPAPQSASVQQQITASHDGSASEVILGDTTAARIPALNQPYEATLRRQSSTIDVPAMAPIPGIRATGSMRTLEIRGQGEALGLNPVVVIPAAEAGSTDPETINVLRVSDLWVDGEWIPNYAMALPVTRDGEGNFVFTDPAFVDSLKPAPGANAVGLIGALNNTQQHWIGHVRYQLMTFDDSLNWARPPQLVRMVPTSDAAAGFRRPATVSELVAMRKRPICNLVILVHGHNEEEKEGIDENSIALPWQFAYKWRVWNIFYQEIQQATQTFADAAYPTDCTAFYEFIYPTYRPIFSPVPAPGGQIHETLGETLGRLIAERFQFEPQLNALLEQDIPFNLFITAHSQGGLVARAGLRHMPHGVRKNLKRLVTWGTPHHGASLYTLRYALQAGHNMQVNGVRVPLQNINQSWLFGARYQNIIRALALDTPGIRDLRWESAHADVLRLDHVFPSLTDAAIAAANPPLFSENLTTFNASMAEELQGVTGTPYTYLYGTTSKRGLFMDASTAGLGFDWREARYFATSASEIEKGATLNDLVVQPQHSANDGAVPKLSQKGARLPFAWANDQIHVGDIDHEEFFGAEPPDRNTETREKGAYIAHETFHEKGLLLDTRQPPQLTANLIKQDQGYEVSGQLFFPLHSQPGDFLKGMKVATMNSDQSIGGFQFGKHPDGRFSGTGHLSDAQAAAGLRLMVLFQDNSQMEMTLQAGEGDFTRVAEGWDQLTDLSSGEVLVKANDLRMTAQVVADGAVEVSDRILGVNADITTQMMIKRNDRTAATVLGTLTPNSGTDWLTTRSWDSRRPKQVRTGWEQVGTDESGQPIVEPVYTTITIGRQGAIDRCEWTLLKRPDSLSPYQTVAILGDARPAPIDLALSAGSEFVDWRYDGRCYGTDTLYPDPGESAVQLPEPVQTSVELWLPSAYISIWSNLFN